MVSYAYQVKVFTSIGYNDGDLGFDLYVDGVAAASSDETDTTQTANTINLSRILRLTTGQKVWVNRRNTNGVWSQVGRYSWFSGLLVYAD